MYSFAEINDFVLKHTGSQYFEADIKLYKKHFPNSKLIAELDRAPEFSRDKLDERIVWELLNNQDSCIDCIWENRGFIFDGSKLIPINDKKEANAPTLPAELKIVVENLLKTDLSGAKHNDLKKFVFALKLQDKCADQKKETYLKVLNDFIESLNKEKEDGTNNMDGSGTTEGTNDSEVQQKDESASAETEGNAGSVQGDVQKSKLEPKKKEGQSSNTPE